MSNRRIVIAMSLALPGFVAVTAQAQVLFSETVQTGPHLYYANEMSSSSSSSGLTYKLGDGSTYTAGCFGGGGGPISCAGPLVLASSFTGTFNVRRVVSPDPDFEAYNISNVNWVASLSSDISITGSGTYKVGSPNGGTVQQMTLNLQLNGGPVTKFDSGLIPGGTGGAEPEFDISINKNGLVLYDINLHIVASPVSAAAIMSQVLDDEASIQGYLDSCNCTLPATKLDGSFALVPTLETQEFSQYSVVNVHWNLVNDRNAGFSQTGPITGTGTYWVFADGSGQQLTLDLLVHGEEIPFDSGVIEGTDFPAIDIVLEEEGDLSYGDEVGLVFDELHPE